MKGCQQLRLILLLKAYASTKPLKHQERSLAVEITCLELLCSSDWFRLVFNHHFDKATEVSNLLAISPLNELSLRSHTPRTQPECSFEDSVFVVVFFVFFVCKAATLDQWRLRRNQPWCWSLAAHHSQSQWTHLQKLSGTGSVMGCQVGKKASFGCSRVEVRS